MIRVLVVADTDVAKTVEDVFVRENAIAHDEIVDELCARTCGSGTGAALAGNPLCGEERSNGRHRETIPDNPYVHIASNAGPESLAMSRES
jgi:hypothetical protein